MPDVTDPSWHQQRERDLVDHVERLVTEPKFVLDTSLGRRSAAAAKAVTRRGDKAVDLKRTMSQLRPERELELRMPVGQTLEATFAVNKWLIFQKTIARLVVASVPPTKELLKDERPAPMSAGETRRQLAALPPPLPGVPTTIILVSTAGFEPDAHELAERTSERTIILAEPNAAGGWAMHGSSEISGVLDLLDPEPAAAKRQRVEEAIAAGDDLLTGSLSAEKLSLATRLPLMLVEDVLKSYAKANPGLQAKRLDGRLLLFREGSMPTGKAVGGEGMSLVDRIKTLFGRKGDTERKIAFLSERRAALAQQRDAWHDELFKLEKQESLLRKEFAADESTNARRRITTQLVQLRKEIDRRTQLMSVLNQQTNLVSTHLHNLELLHQGRGAQLPDSETIATDAAAAEEMLAQLQADSELADSMSATTTASLSNEEQALYEELLGEAAAKKSPAASPVSTSATPAGPEPLASPAKQPAPPIRTPTREPG
jgi:hypothetical protein